MPLNLAWFVCLSASIVAFWIFFRNVCGEWLEDQQEDREGREGRGDIRYGVAISSSGGIELVVIIGSSFDGPGDP